MSTYENINVEEPEQLGPGEWTCKVTWSGPACRGSESIRRTRSTHFEARSDAKVIASRLRNQNQTAVTKGDMPPLPSPGEGVMSGMAQAMASISAHGSTRYQSTDIAMALEQASQAETIEADDLARAFERDIQAANDEIARKEEELGAVAKALGCERGEILEKIADLQDQLAKESKEANHLAALAAGRLDVIIAKNDEIDRIAQALGCESDEIMEKLSASMGVGDGSGSLFVYGDIEAITAAQALVLRAEKAGENDEIRRLTEEVADLDGQIEALNRKADGLASEIDDAMSALMSVGIYDVTLVQGVVAAASGCLNGDDVKSFIRCMGIEPGDDIKADLSACLARHDKTRSDLDDAYRTVKKQYADLSVERERSEQLLSALENFGKVMASLTDAE